MACNEHSQKVLVAVLLQHQVGHMVVNMTVIFAYNLPRLFSCCLMCKTNSSTQCLLMPISLVV